MTARRLPALAASLLVAGLLGGCSMLPVPNPLRAPGELDVTVSNGTDLDLAITVNGRLFAQVLAHDGRMLSAGELGPLPWTIDAITTSGRRLTSLVVKDGSVACLDGADGSRSCSGALTLLDLTCGRLVIGVSPTPPWLPAPMPGAGQPGDCRP